MKKKKKKTQSSAKLYKNPIIYYHFFCKDHHYNTFYLATNVPPTLYFRPSDIDLKRYRTWFSKISNLQYFT